MSKSYFVTTFCFEFEEKEPHIKSTGLYKTKKFGNSTPYKASPRFLASIYYKAVQWKTDNQHAYC